MPPWIPCPGTPSLVRAGLYFTHNLSPTRMNHAGAPDGFFGGKPLFACAGETPARQPARRRRYNLSAARSFALRDRGLRSISSSSAVTGFFVSKR